ncbi:MAG: AMP-binding protein, partial [Pseudanabaena sp.]
MDWKPIEKPKIQGTVLPNLLNYEETCSTFSWDKIANELKSVSDRQGINIADIAIDRHATGANGDRLAMRFIGKDWTISDFSYNQLKAQSNQFANVLQSLGVTKGDRIFVLAGRIPALYIAALGTLKNGSVFCPMFSAFGPEPI